MRYPVINLQEKFTKFRDIWSPKIVAQMNDIQFKLARVKGEFVWHSHTETDEVFLVLDGRLFIDFPETSLTLEKGELVVVPRGVRHKPHSENECQVLVIESCGTVNTGEITDRLTKKEIPWI